MIGAPAEVILDHLVIVIRITVTQECEWNDERLRKAWEILGFSAT